MTNVDIELKRMREEVYEKPLTRTTIVEFFQQKGQSFHPHLIDTYFEFKHGKCSMDDFLSTLMLIHHHQHIDLTTGFFIELHPLLKLIEHNKLLNRVELDPLQNILKKFENSLLSIATQHFDSERIKATARIAVYFKDRPTDFLDVSIFTNIEDDIDYTKLNKFNLPIRQVGKQMAISLFNKHVECEFMEKLFEVESGKFELLLESDTSFDGVVELKDLQSTPEFRVQMLKSGLHTNSEFVIGEYLRVLMLGAYGNKKAASLMQTLYKTTGHAVLNNLRKMAFLKNLMAFSPIDPKSVYQNIILTSLWENILFAMDNDFSASVSFLKALNESFFRENLEVKIRLFGIEISSQMTCEKLNPLVAKFTNSLLLYSNAVSLMKIENMLQEERLESQIKNKDRQEVVTSMTNINQYILNLVEQEYHSKSGRASSQKNVQQPNKVSKPNDFNNLHTGIGKSSDNGIVPSQPKQLDSEASKNAHEVDHRFSKDEKSLQQGSTRKIMAWKQERTETEVITYSQSGSQVKKTTFNELISKTSIESKTEVNVMPAIPFHPIQKSIAVNNPAKNVVIVDQIRRWRPFYVRALSIMTIINLRKQVQKKRSYLSKALIKSINKRALGNHDRISQKSSQRSGDTSGLPSHNASFDNSFEAPLQKKQGAKKINPIVVAIYSVLFLYRLKNKMRKRTKTLTELKRNKRWKKIANVILFVLRLLKKLREKYENFNGSEMYPFLPYVGSFKDIVAFNQGFKPKTVTSTPKRSLHFKIIIKCFMTFYALFLASRKRREKLVHRCVKKINSAAINNVVKIYQKTVHETRKKKSAPGQTKSPQIITTRPSTINNELVSLIDGKNSLQRVSSSINSISARDSDAANLNRRITRKALHNKGWIDYLGTIVWAIVKFKRILLKIRRRTPQLSARRIIRLRLKLKCYSLVIYSFICLKNFVVRRSMAKKESMKLRASQSFGAFNGQNSKVGGVGSSRLSFNNREGFFGYLKYIVAKHVVKSNVDLIEYYLANELRNRQVSYVTNAFEGVENTIDPKNIKYHNVANLVRTAAPVPVQVYKANAEEQMLKFQKQVAHKIFRRISILNYPVILKQETIHSANLFDNTDISESEQRKDSKSAQIKIQRLSQLRKEVQNRKSISLKKLKTISPQAEDYSDIIKKSSQHYDSEIDKDETVKDHPISFAQSEGQTKLSHLGFEEETFRLFKAKNEDVIVLVRNSAKVSSVTVRQAISLLQADSGSDEQEDLQVTRKIF
jgi:hypothetical protein